MSTWWETATSSPWHTQETWVAGSALGRRQAENSMLVGEAEEGLGSWGRRAAVPCRILLTGSHRASHTWPPTSNSVH